MRDRGWLDDEKEVEKAKNVWTIQPRDVGINAAACISLCLICAAGRRAGARPDGAFGDHPLLAAAAADDAQNHDGNARSGLSRASASIGSGWSP
jgi:hypothetical protein